MGKKIGPISSVIILINLIVSINLQAQGKNKIPGLDTCISNIFKNLKMGTMPGASVLVAQN